MADEPGRNSAVADLFAAEIAVVVDKIRMTLMQSALAQGFPASFHAAGLDTTSGMLLGYLRNAYPDRVVNRTAVRSVFTYHPDNPVDSGLEVLIRCGLLVEPSPGTVTLTGAGRACLEDLHAVADQTARQAWGDPSESVVTCAPLVARALLLAWETGGDAFSLMAPDQLPISVSEQGLLAERLTGLRFHRFDAHIAAWRAAGYEAADLESLSESVRSGIEADTNKRAAAPYAELSEAERDLLLAGLRDLAATQSTDPRSPIASE